MEGLCLGAMDRRKDSDKQLDPPAVFRVPRSTEPRELIPPAHFQSRSAPPLAAPAALPWSSRSLSNWEAAELKRENQRLKDELYRRSTKGEKLEEAGNRSRSLEKETEPLNACHTLAMSQQAEIISHQLHEIQRLEAELATLRVASAQQEAVAASRETTIVTLRGELAELKSQSQAEVAALKTELEEVKKGSRLETEAVREELEELKKQSRLEADSLREELELTKERHGHELGLAQGESQGVLEKKEAEWKQQEERAQECLQSVLTGHQAELSKLSEVHGAEVASLRHQLCVLQQELEIHQKETVQLREKRDDLQNQLSMAKTELASQNALVLQLKTYVGEQESRQPTSEQERLRSRVQQLEDEKDALKITAELLQVRLASLNDILTLQETELSKKVQIQDPLQPDSSQKLQRLLTRWREKVFSLLVQLKSQELCHRNTTKQLDWKIKELEDEVESREQKVALLLHSLEDKTAEANVEQVRNKTLQAEALRSKELSQKLQQRAEAAENALKGLGNLVSRLSQQQLGQEETWKAALSRLVGLGNRIAFAAKRVDTIQGLVCQKIALAKLQQAEKTSIVKLTQEKIQSSYEDLQAELQMLHEERDQLAMELKRGAQLIERKVAEAREKVESDLQEMREKSQSLQEALEAKAVVEQALRHQQEDTERQLEKACQDLQKSEEAAENLRQELGQMRKEYETAPNLSLFTMGLLQDENCNSSIKEHLVAGLQELVSIAGLLLLPWPHNDDICTKTRDCVNSTSLHFSVAERKLEAQLLLLDSQSEALIMVKKLLEDDLQEKKGNLADLRAQILTLEEAQKKSQAMLEAAELHLEKAREQLRLAHEEVAKNRAGREIGYWLLIIPVLGSFIGAGMVVGYQVALGSAENLVAEAQRAVTLCTAEVDGYRNEIAQLSQKEQEVQAGINAANQKIPQIQAECDEVLAFHKAVMTQQSSIRKFCWLLDLLGGKIHAAAVMSSHACIPGFLVDILEEMAGVVEGQSEVAFCASEEIQASFLEINKAVKSLRTRAGGNISIAS